MEGRREGGEGEGEEEEGREGGGEREGEEGERREGRGRGGGRACAFKSLSTMCMHGAVIVLYMP